jgi:hypothetical protein
MQMMNCKRISVLALALVGALLLASAAYAGPPTVFLISGSSAQFPTAGIAAISPDPVTGGAAPCGAHIWTGKNGSLGATVLGVDPREAAGTPPFEPGNIWVTWDVEPNPTVVCAYLSVDSVVGLRLFYGQGSGGDWTAPTTGNGTLHFVTGTAVGNLITGFPDTDATVPCDVASAIDSNAADTCKAAAPVGFTAAATDIRPEDGQYAYGRAAVTFGYNPGAAVCGPNPVLSSFTATNGQVCAFHISGNDPVSGVAIPASQTYPLGAAPVIIFGNNNGTLVGTGCPFPTNILSKTAAKLWSGQIGTSQEAFGPGVCNAQLSVIQREPTSGTDNTFEFQLVHSRDGNSSDTQEENGASNVAIVGNPPSGNCPTPPAAFTAPYTCTNPLVLTSGQNSIRFRAIGTGEMVKAVDGGTGLAAPPYNNRFGYAFYSLGSFYAAALANVQYLTLEGVDGLYASYTTGAFGTCTGSIPAGTFKCTTNLPGFPNIINGSYRVWSNYRWAMGPNASGATGGLGLGYKVLLASQDQAHFAITNPGANGGGITCNNCVIKAVADFVAPQDLPVFRSHYPLGSAGVVPADANNGTSSPATGFCAADQTAPNCIEEGGDMAGVAFFAITDQQYFNATGGELLTEIE